MTITKKPHTAKPTEPRPVKHLAEPAAPETFIQAADHPSEAPAEEPEALPEPLPELAEAVEIPAKKDKKPKDKKKKKDKRKKKEAVLIRFEHGQIEEIDGQATALGLSRAAFVRMAVSRALEK